VLDPKKYAVPPARWSALFVGSDDYATHGIHQSFSRQERNVQDRVSMVRCGVGFNIVQQSGGDCFRLK
jgi:hypothetical protein